MCSRLGSSGTGLNGKKSRAVSGVILCVGKIVFFFPVPLVALIIYFCVRIISHVFLRWPWQYIQYNVASSHFPPTTTTATIILCLADREWLAQSHPVNICDRRLLLTPAQHLYDYTTKALRSGKNKKIKWMICQNHGLNIGLPKLFDVLTFSLLFLLRDSFFYPLTLALWRLIAYPLGNKPCWIPLDG